METGKVYEVTYRIAVNRDWTKTIRGTYRGIVDMRAMFVDNCYTSHKIDPRMVTLIEEV